MGMNYKHIITLPQRLAAIALFSSLTPVFGQALMPLPEEVIAQRNEGNAILDLPDRLISVTGLSLKPSVPDNVKIVNNGGDIVYNSDNNTLDYQSNGGNILLTTDNGTEMQAARATANLKDKHIELGGPISIYQKDILIKAKDKASFHWENNHTTAQGIRAKINGFLIRGSSIEYKTFKTIEKGKEVEKRCIIINDAYVTTEDTKNPSTWIGTGNLTIYPGDSGTVSRLGINMMGRDVSIVPFSFNHSLNPREGYLPNFGSRSTWGTYFMNSYGILFGGNRKTDGFMPTDDYLATLHADYRTRRGLAFGLDLEDIAMTKKHAEMKGLEMYYVQDTDPMINPQRGKRQHTDHERYRISLKTEWDISPKFDNKSKWQLNTNINVLSDQYMLRDFLEEESRVDSKPDNTVRVERRTASTHAMLYTRFAANDFYATDERIEGTFYRVRQTIGNTGITYETRNSAGIMRQYVPFNERISYQNKLNNIADADVREYYERLLNTDSYIRVNSTHEISTSYKILRALNVTPKAGFGYSGYYDAVGVGSEHRFLGYLGCDFDLKFHRHYNSFAYTPIGLKGLTHVFRPYASISHTDVSTTNGIIPQLDAWSSALGSSTNSAMPMDLIGFTGVDSWNAWTIWRLGMRNAFTSSIDGEKVKLLDWNTFIDYNIDNPLTERQFSNLYNIITFTPTKRTRLYVETQTPTFKNGDGYHRYNIRLDYMPIRWLECNIGYLDFKGHPIYSDSEQIQTGFNIRFSEKLTGAIRCTWDTTEGRMPIQQYSLFRNVGPWYVGATIFVRDNGGKREEGFGISFTLAETGTALPINVL